MIERMSRSATDVISRAHLVDVNGCDVLVRHRQVAPKEEAVTTEAIL